MNIKKITVILLAVLMVASLFGCNKKGENNEENEAVASAPAVWSEQTVVTQDMYVYYFNGYYRYFLESNADNLDALGLDPAQSLSAQQQSEEYNWQQYMTLQVYRQLREMIALVDAAKAEGMEITEADKTDIENQIAKYDTLAAEASMSVDSYIVEVYGKGVTKDVMREAITLKFLANKYYEKLWSGYEYTEDDCNAYYEENMVDFLYFDYISVTVTPDEADAIKAATDEESFVSAIRESITRTAFMGEYDRFANSIEDQVKKKYHYISSIDSESEFGKWVLEDSRAGYEIYSETEDNGYVTISMVLPTDRDGAVSQVVYRINDALKNFMYMIFADGDGTTGEVKADTIYKNWQEEPTQERFESLCQKYDGGTAEKVIKEQLSEDISSWVFDPERVTGDCGMVTVDGGAYLLYLMEDSGPSWMEDVKSTLKNESYAEDVNLIIDKYPTQYDADFIYNVTEVEISAAGNDTPR